VEKYLWENQKTGLHSPSHVQLEAELAQLGLALQDNNLEKMKEKTQSLERLFPVGSFGNFADMSSMFSDVFGQRVSNARPNGSRSYNSGAATSKDSKSPKGSQQSEQLVESKKGLFAAGQNFDAKNLVRELFIRAKHTIVIIDAYVGEDVLTLLTAKTAGVNVRILTGNVAPALLSLGRDFNIQYKGLEVRSSKAFHDRFVILDENEFYHFGASLEHLGNKTFMFSKIDEPLVTAALHEHWNSEWEKAAKVL
jgi:hypothetical protein